MAVRRFGCFLGSKTDHQLLDRFQGLSITFYNNIVVPVKAVVAL